jgi:hypothetical protein
MSLHKNDLRVWGVLRLMYAIIYWNCGLMISTAVFVSIFPTMAPIVLPVGIVWIFVGILATIPIQAFVCPRCKKFYFEKQVGVFLWKNPFSRKCFNCQLPKWAEVDIKLP